MNWRMVELSVVRYNVYRGDSKAGTVTGDTYSYSFTGLAVNNSYTFKVIAYDAAGNYAASADYTVKTSAESYNGYIPPVNGPDQVVTGSHFQVMPVVKDGAAQAALHRSRLRRGRKRLC